jgi:hypothetical protein
LKTYQIRGQEIPHILWNLKVQYHAHNSPPLTPLPQHY